MSTSEQSVDRIRRDRNSSWTVRFSDRIAKQVITIGGIGTILVVLLVVLVLLGNVLPMFQPNSMLPLATILIVDSESEVTPTNSKDGTAIACGVDEYSELLWVLHRNGSIDVFAVNNGHRLQTFASAKPNESAELGQVSCAVVAQNDQSLMAGYANGLVRPVTIKTVTEFIKGTELPTGMEPLSEGQVTVVNDTVFRALPGGLVRKQSIDEIVFHDAIRVSDESIRCIDWKTPQAASSFDESQNWVWTASDGSTLAYGTVENKVNSFNGEISQSSKLWKHVSSNTDSSSTISVMLGARDDQIQTLDSSGRVVQWIASDNDSLKSGMTHRSLAGAEGTATMAIALLGRSTMLIASKSGHIESVAVTATEAGQELLSIHQFAGDHGSILCMESAPENRVVASSFEDGLAALYYVPTNRMILDWKLPIPTDGSDSGKIFFSSNAASIGFLSNNYVHLWKLNVSFPEASFASFFSRVWYEGYSGPQHVWQSSTGNIEGEYKFGFLPLIFGTLKATFYSMLIGAPIALLAAIFGSEFMNSRWRARVKPLIELMASVPSVVLGFIGALVLAPILRENLMQVLLSVVCILTLFLFAAHLWLVIPSPAAIRWRRLRLPILFALIPVGILVAGMFAPGIENLLFGGNLIGWLSNTTGSGWSGWFCLGLLPSTILVGWAMSVPLSPYVQVVAKSMDTFRFSLLNVGFFFLAASAVVAVSALLAACFAGLGWDPRGVVLGPYQERNALLVGSILGFAIIPLIYTISEDALQSVPQHLRSASLGCGATTWQTTIRVVVPTAMSGLFSALMIGFGRAVGETMVVLMAAGNTPVMDINPMNGYRTLSATLATELPEAARGTTHYHALFLAAFLLFCFTMLANTFAEVVRMRFRKRAYQL